LADLTGSKRLFALKNGFVFVAAPVYTIFGLANIVRLRL
jgi:hypothetical protein